MEIINIQNNLSYTEGQLIGVYEALGISKDLNYDNLRDILLKAVINITETRILLIKSTINNELIPNLHY